MNLSLAEEYFKYMLDESNESRKSSYSKVLEAGFQILIPVHKKNIGQLRSSQNQDAMILFQMVLSKGLAIQELINGVNYKNSKTKVISNFLDPTPIAVLTRSQFEAFSIFHNIYISNNDQNVIDLLHDIWVVAGLKERQKGFESTIEEYKIKAAKEKEKIDGLLTRIQSNPIFCKEEKEKQSKILEWIKNRKIEITYRNNKLVQLSQKDLFINSGVNKNFENQYSLLSWFVHPSYISVLQFSQMYDNKFNHEHAYTFLKVSRIIMSMLIADYATYFDVANEEFKNLPKIDQLIIHTDNKTFRSKSEFKSDVMEELELEILEFLNKNKR
jgi:hypothetical protein